MPGRIVKMMSFNPDAHRFKDAPEQELTPDAADLIDEIDGALTNDDFAWAVDTLSGIKDTIEARGDCTEGQQRAVRNILDRRRR